MVSSERRLPSSLSAALLLFVPLVVPACGGGTSNLVEVSIFDVLIVTTTSLPGVLVGVAYDESITVTGGDGSNTWAITAGALPAGLSLAASTGAVSGSPTASGTSTFTVEVTSGDGQVASQQLSIEVYGVLTVTTTSLLPALENSAYSSALAASGGEGSYTWRITAGTLPSGLTLDGADGTISGTTGGVESPTFTVEVTSGDGQVASQPLTLTVANLLGRWLDGGGNPITSANVGDGVHFQLCYTDPDIAAFQATLQGFGANATAESIEGLDSSGAGVPGVHPDCAGTLDVLDAGFTASGTSDPITALVVSNASGPGTGPAGILWIGFDLTASGVIQIDLPPESIVSSDHAGNSLHIFVGIFPLTVN